MKSSRLGRAEAPLQKPLLRVKGGEVWLEGMNIPVYEQASYNNHEPLRSRKLLMSKDEIEEITKGLERKGLTLIPLKLYFNKGWAKLSVGLAKGKKLYDKRHDKAKKDAQREMQRAMKQR